LYEISQLGTALPKLEVLNLVNNPVQSKWKRSYTSLCVTVFTSAVVQQSAPALEVALSAALLLLIGHSPGWKAGEGRLLP
jgi:hypothetical protein